MIPAIIQALTAAEEFAPLPQQGKAKPDFVLGILTDTDDDVAGMLPAITKVIARIVALANATGVFGRA